VCVCVEQGGQTVQQAFDSAKMIVSSASDVARAAEHSKFSLLGHGDHSERLFESVQEGGMCRTPGVPNLLLLP
jgi:hypothetical protein